MKHINKTNPHYKYMLVLSLSLFLVLYLTVS